MDIQHYVKPELLVLIPVIYIIGIILKRSKVKDKHIPLILGFTCVCMATIWVLANSHITCFTECMAAIFCAITQGVLIAGADVYTNQVFKQSKKDD